MSRRDDPDAYVRRMVVNAHISAWRRSGRQESPVAEVRDATAADPAQLVVEHDAVWRMCRALPPQQRAAVVLRFYEGTYVVDFTCPLVLAPDRSSHGVNASTVSPWVGNGIPAVVYGPTGGKGAMIDSFIGPLG